MAANTVRIRAVLDDKVSSSLSRIRDSFDRLGKSKGAASILQGVGVGAGISAWGLLDSAVSRVVGVMGDATKAAMEEEASIARLGASLRANVPAWNGNTDAIEATLQARIKLGFADDEQRDSLARLVVATQSETKALAIQRAAMDLARLKNIDLGTATDALIKIEGGQFRALKALGIELEKGATTTDALRAVQKAASGQAEAYAKTNAGKLLTSQVRVGEAMEKLGGTTMPLVADGMVAAAEAVEGLVSALETVDEATDAIGGLGGVLESLPFVGPAAQANRFANELKAAEEEATNLRQAVDAGRHHIKGAMEDIGGASRTLADVVKVSTEDSASSFEKMTDAFESSVSDAISNAFDPLIAEQELVAINAEVSAARRAVAAGKATSAEKLALLQAQEAQAEHLATLAKAGKTTSAAFGRGLADLKTNIKNSSGAAKAALQEIYDRIMAFKNIKLNIAVNVKGNVGVSGARAHGGPVQADKAYLVGEEGPELFMPSSGGAIIPNGNTGASVSGGGTTIVFNSLWPPTPQMVRDVYKLMDAQGWSSLESAAPFNGR